MCVYVCRETKRKPVRNIYVDGDNENHYELEVATSTLPPIKIRVSYCGVKVCILALEKLSAITDQTMQSIRGDWRRNLGVVERRTHSDL